jgi:uncharacterized DUF497 family protein
MEFDFDPKKSQSNKIKHGIDFEEAKELWDDPYRLLIPARCSDEERWVMIARLLNVYWSVIYSVRSGVIRIISVRKSRQNEKEIYHS